jgi:GntR family transcriptional regulator/MocR family aminotransferase
LREPVLDTMRLRRDAVSSIEQAALAEFVASGRLDRHVRAQRLRYRRRRDTMVHALRDTAPWLDVTGVSAGLHVTAFLRGHDERDVIHRAAQESVAAFPHAIATLTRVLEAC